MFRTARSSLGEHTNEVLEEMGLSKTQIDEVLAEGVIWKASKSRSTSILDFPDIEKVCGNSGPPTW
jgi:hypothetical protein